jgi:hypothetical protein
LSAISAAFRLAALAGLAASRNAEIFRVGLCWLAWPTVVLEACLAHHWTRTPARAAP